MTSMVRWPWADEWEVYDNSDTPRVLVAVGSPDEELIGDEDRWKRFQRSSEL